MASRTTEVRRLNRLLSRYEATVRAAFRDYIARTRSAFTLKYLADLIERGRVQEALNVVDSYVVRLGSAVVPRVYQDVAIDETTRLGRAFLPDRTTAVITFDPTHWRAAESMRRNRLNFIAAFTRQQRETTRAALVEGLMTGTGPRAVARTFLDSIGLTRTQLQAVSNYRSLLENNSREALHRELRDRRFDRTVDRVFSAGEVLEAAQVERMTQRYYEGMLSLRAETISRTETQRVLNQARQEALLQAVEQGGIDPSMIERVWRATDDDRTRDSHWDMEGQVVGLNEPFVSGAGHRLMYPGDPSAPAEEIINCRCTVTHRLIGTDVEMDEEEEAA
jgi:hypothetical protein